jgi:4-hydroxybenzoate polyprenyltransferase
MGSLSLLRLFALSRPRFWLYELGTFAIGVVVALSAYHTTNWWLVGAFAVYFWFPANLLIYGINDVYDYETDLRNPKKQGYEDVLAPALHGPVLRAVLYTSAPFVVLALFTASSEALVAFLLFLGCAVFYSMPPVRAKARPVLDSLFSAGHYVATGVFGYYLAGGSGDVLLPVVAGMLWAMAMHAYSAVPDIAADTEAGVPTIATTLGAYRTLIVCFLAYAAAGFIAYLYLDIWSLLLTVPYLVLMVRSFWCDEVSLLRVYRYFPYLNALVGMIIFLLVLGGKLVG